MSEIVSKALAYAKSCHEGDFSGHDFEHIERVLANVERILLDESTADAEVVRVAAILHDVDDYKLGENEQRVASFFAENGVPDEFAEKVQTVIEGISFSKSGSAPKFQNVEQKIVSDADKLDAMGAIGVCRTVMYSAASGRPLFVVDEFPEENLTAEQYKNKNRKGNHSINHFFDKLLKLKGAMQTEGGRREAEKRHQFMLLFLNEFFDEVRADEWKGYLNSRY